VQSIGSAKIKFVFVYRERNGLKIDLTTGTHYRGVTKIRASSHCISQSLQNDQPYFEPVSRD